ncbi:MAG: hypothetical protein BWX88_04078 [Planctomycetes bacterium ADurb.Bin126]|nr:MAG: hypothetical protein BWX88_04078 [Planctomycetes bacterium ADurb.Bin126]HOD81051.1 DUF2442 domain-containing protein [Phycisphaerae bacterium]HQL75657.1 DUF2442 domain-containing protein [Phycisphaerae bacterium]
MSSLRAKINNVVVGRDTLNVELADGRVITAPLTWYPTLLQATAKQLRRWKPCGAGTGIHWPDLDYHLSVEGLLRGSPEAEGVTRRLLVDL